MTSKHAGAKARMMWAILHGDRREIYGAVFRTKRSAHLHRLANLFDYRWEIVRVRVTEVRSKRKGGA